MAPARIAGAGVEMNPAGSNGRVPVHDRWLHSLVRRLRDAGFEPMRDQGPTVVVTGLEDVQLVAPHRPMFGLPQQAGHRIDGKALRIAMAVGPDGRYRSRPAHERVVRRDGAVVVDAVHLAQRAAEVLRGLWLAAFADRVEEPAPS